MSTFSFFLFFFRKRKEEWTKNRGRVEEKGAKKRVAGEGFRLCHANQKINFAPPYNSFSVTIYQKSVAFKMAQQELKRWYHSSISWLTL